MEERERERVDGMGKGRKGPNSEVVLLGSVFWMKVGRDALISDSSGPGPSTSVSKGRPDPVRRGLSKIRTVLADDGDLLSTGSLEAGWGTADALLGVGTIGTGGSSCFGAGWGGGDARLAARAVGIAGRPKVGARWGGGVSRLGDAAENDPRLEAIMAGWAGDPGRLTETTGHGGQMLK